MLGISWNSPFKLTELPHFQILMDPHLVSISSASIPTYLCQPLPGSPLTSPHESMYKSYLQSAHLFPFPLSLSSPINYGFHGVFLKGVSCFLLPSKIPVTSQPVRIFKKYKLDPVVPLLKWANYYHHSWHKCKMLNTAIRLCLLLSWGF